MNELNHYNNEIVCLQLKKPKKWNWEISTSKSSPHIALPTIQLYNSKGQLLVQTNDNGIAHRQSWNSLENENANNTISDCQNSLRLQRSRSDNLVKKLNKYRSSTIPSCIATSETTLKELNGANGTYNAVSPSLGSKRRNRSSEYVMANVNRTRSQPISVQNYVQTNYNGIAYRQIGDSLEKGNTNTISDCRNSLRLQRSRSDNLVKKLNKYRSSTIPSYIATSETTLKEQNGVNGKYNVVPPSLGSKRRNRSSEFVMANMNRTLSQPIGEQTYGKSNFPYTEKKFTKPYHSRSNSDDIFQKTRKKYDIMESKKRAENDGYLNFINGQLTYQGEFNKENKTGGKKNVAEKNNKHILGSSAIETVHSNHIPHNMEITHLPQPKRYRLRQSRAGILVISDESFSSSHRRRCHGDIGDCRQDSNDVIIEGDLLSSLENLSYSKNKGSVFSNANLPKSRRLKENKIYHSKSDSFPFAKSLHFPPTTCDKSNCFSFDKIYKNGEYEYEPAAYSNRYRGNIDRRKRTTVPMSNNYDIPTSPNFKETRKGLRIGSQKLSKSGDCDLQHLVERHSSPRIQDNYIESNHTLQNTNFSPCSPIDRIGSKIRNGEAAVNQEAETNNCDVSSVMGANVSRHSTKGLSGRRSQSSGSICNGKERCQGDGSGKGSGGSLPSYLDERGSTSTNNNVDDEERAALNDDERIPPLGDGALLHWKFSDNQTTQCQDQGYGSERSPEEEYPPALPEHDLEQCHHHLEPHSCYPFITPETTFSVKLSKGSRGLGLSVTGGIESGGSWPGLVRIKRLFPHQPASACGLLNVGDLLLEVNGVPLTGLTNYEALEVLRTASNQVELKVSRPPPDVLNCVSPISEVPPPPPTRRDPSNSLDISSNLYGTTPEDEYYHGEFEVILTKIQGSLGFTLRKEDDSALGHYVRALVREPALTDGRIKAGDKIIAVNDVEIFPMTHEQAVQYLRQCGDKVKLRLYRDSPQTPVAALSPSETTPRTSFSRKANLRPEAVDMLNDIALRKLVPRNAQQGSRRSQSPTSSPRRLRRQNYPSDVSQEAESRYLIPEEQFHEGMLKCKHFDEEAFNSLFTIDSEDMDRPLRPNSLDLYNPNQTPVAARKPRFNFSLAHNAYELNNLDPEVLDAPNLTYTLGNEEGDATEADCGDSFPKEPASMPHIPLDNSSMAFSYRNPAYQSAHPPCVENDIRSSCSASNNNQYTQNEEETDTIKRKKGILKKDSKKHLEKSETKTDTEVIKLIPMKEEFEILAIELNRGWNSRLGFSLQGAAGVTYVSAVYNDSVAARDGRIKPGDRIIKVNDEEVDHMSTNEIIDLLRIVRGPVCIFVKRIKSNEDCTKSNAEN